MINHLRVKEMALTQGWWQIPYSARKFSRWVYVCWTTFLKHFLLNVCSCCPLGKRSSDRDVYVLDCIWYKLSAFTQFNILMHWSVNLLITAPTWFWQVGLAFIGKYLIKMIYNMELSFIPVSRYSVQINVHLAYFRTKQCRCLNFKVWLGVNSR